MAINAQLFYYDPVTLKGVAQRTKHIFVTSAPMTGLEGVLHNRNWSSYGEWHLSPHRVDSELSNVATTVHCGALQQGKQCIEFSPPAIDASRLAKTIAFVDPITEV